MFRTAWLPNYQIQKKFLLNLNGGNIFFEAGSFWCRLKKKNVQLTTINIHKGLYKRLPFGIKVASAIFQQAMDTMFTDCGFAVAYLDEILIKSVTKEQYISHFEKIWVQTQWGKLWIVFAKNGHQPDLSRTSAIKNIPLPTNITRLQAFLWLANYYQSYIPNMQNLRAPQNNLLKKGVKWNWTDKCEKAFEEIK